MQRKAYVIPGNKLSAVASHSRHGRGPLGNDRDGAMNYILFSSMADSMRRNGQISIRPMRSNERRILISAPRRLFSPVGSKPTIINAELNGARDDTPPLLPATRTLSHTLQAPLRLTLFFKISSEAGRLFYFFGGIWSSDILKYFCKHVVYFNGEYQIPH